MLQFKLFDACRYDSDNEMFLLRVRECVEASKASVYDPPAIDDPHAIVFSQYQPAIHDQVREELKKERNESENSLKEEGSSNNGLSWVKPGTLQIFSKTAS
ncbi:hypothetical protein SK128_003701 [Halocaridina rubra]|uniref:Uncharacterized protein n=1 Tax=Halocaridina rubra TaxID=373956 RepID=A0AAN8WMJ6_HALRR